MLSKNILGATTSQIRTAILFSGFYLGRFIYKGVVRYNETRNEKGFRKSH